MSIPREVGLRRTSEGIRLVQKPAREMESLRDRQVAFSGGDVAKANAWLADQQVQGKQLELLVELAPSNSGVAGVKVLQGANEATVIGVDRVAGRVFVDRSQSGSVGFNPQFPGVQDAPLPRATGRVQLHIFVDACSVEVFVNNGERVITDLVYPSAGSNGLKFFGLADGTKIRSAQVWTLKSAWR
jgi:sucrose-6-phosphate hydrolase SacC (GH32 family)